MSDTEKDPIKEILDTLDPEKDKTEPAKEPAKEPVKETLVTDPIEAIAKERGWTKAQAAEHVAVENTAKAFREVETKHPDMSKYKDIMEKELSTYAPELRRNPALIEKVYYMSKGIALEKASANKEKSDTAPTRRIAEPFPGRDGGSGGSESSKESKLSDEEKRVAKFLRVDENAYEKSKGKKNLRDAVERTSEKGGNAADLALNGLTRRR